MKSIGKKVNKLIKKEIKYDNLQQLNINEM
jgi:hypothetical protein